MGQRVGGSGREAVGRVGSGGEVVGKWEGEGEGGEVLSEQGLEE